MPTPRIRPLPKQLYLGPDRPLITVKVVPALDFAGKVNNESAGAWVKEDNTILIRDDISLTRRWVAFREELAHALIDNLAPPV